MFQHDWLRTSLCFLTFHRCSPSVHPRLVLQDTTLIQTSVWHRETTIISSTRLANVSWGLSIIYSIVSFVPGRNDPSTGQSNEWTIKAVTLTHFIHLFFFLTNQPKRGNVSVELKKLLFIFDIWMNEISKRGSKQNVNVWKSQWSLKYKCLIGCY